MTSHGHSRPGEDGHGFDPFDAEQVDDLYGRYRHLRTRAPIHYVEAHDLWIVSRYDDCRAVLLDHATWSSAQGNMIDQPRALAGETIGSTDRPRHRVLRGIFNTAFATQGVAALEPDIRALVRARSSDIEQRGRVDLVTDFAKPLLSSILLGLLFGVPASDHLMLQDLVDRTGARGPDGADLAPEALEARTEAVRYLVDLVREHRRTGHDDMLKTLMIAECEGRRLDDTEVAGAALSLIASGAQATAWLITHIAAVLSRHIDQRQLLCADPWRIPNAVEETLRYDSVSQSVARTSVRDVEFGGKHIRQGQRVCVLLGAANRDEGRFARADTFDIHRSDAGRHLSFGHGIHLCVGAPLVRLVCRIVFEELLAAFPDYEIVPEESMRIRAPALRGYSKLSFTTD